MTPAARREDFAPVVPIKTVSLRQVSGDPQPADAVAGFLGQVGGVSRIIPTATLIEIMAMRPDLGLDVARQINDALLAVRG